MLVWQASANLKQQPCLTVVPKDHEKYIAGSDGEHQPALRLNDDDDDAKPQQADAERGLAMSELEWNQCWAFHKTFSENIFWNIVNVVKHVLLLKL